MSRLPVDSPRDALRPDMNPRVTPSISGAADMLNDMWRTTIRLATLRALADAGCLEQLGGGPLTTAELAGRCGVHEPSLARLLRAAAQTGLLREAGTGTYTLTGAGQALVTGQGAARMRWIRDPEAWNSLGELPETLTSGVPPVVGRHGSAWAYLAARPVAAAAFDELMTEMYEPVAERLAEADDVPPAGTVVDLGGGRGTFIGAILRARPGLAGILVDQARSLAAARKYLADRGVGDRCEVAEGDFFQAVPPGAECYLLAHVIHNWDDSEAAEILRVVRSAMPRAGRLLLVEQVVPGGDGDSFAKDLDVRLLAAGLGRERSLAEYSALLAAAGLRPARSTELGRGEHLITAVPG